MESGDLVFAFLPFGATGARVVLEDGSITNAGLTVGEGTPALWPYHPS